MESRGHFVLDCLRWRDYSFRRAQHDRETLACPSRYSRIVCFGMREHREVMDSYDASDGAKQRHVVVDAVEKIEPFAAHVSRQTERPPAPREPISLYRYRSQIRNRFSFANYVGREVSGGN
jgi:hypothetical protein